MNNCFRVWDAQENQWTDPSYLECMFEGELVCFLDKNQDRFVIQQSTGAKDIEGNLIFEGDVVDICDEFSFDENYQRRYKAVKKVDSRTHMDKFVLVDKEGQECIWLYTQLKVIGNIFETK